MQKQGKNRQKSRKIAKNRDKSPKTAPPSGQIIKKNQKNAHQRRKKGKKKTPLLGLEPPSNPPKSQALNQLSYWDFCDFARPIRFTQIHPLMGKIATSAFKYAKLSLPPPKNTPKKRLSPKYRIFWFCPLACLEFHIPPSTAGSFEEGKNPLSGGKTL